MSLIRSLADCDKGLSTHIGGDLSILICEVRDSICSASRAGNPSLLSSTVRALFILQTFFSSTSGDFKSWVPSAKESAVVHNACTGRYPDGTIEGDFSKYGGKYGIAALAQMFRALQSDAIFSHWDAIEDRVVKEWLVASVSRLFKFQENPWVEKCEPQSTLSEIQYLGKHPNRRKQRIDSRALTPPSDISNLGMGVRLPPPTSPALLTHVSQTASRTQAMAHEGFTTSSLISLKDATQRHSHTAMQFSREHGVINATGMLPSLQEIALGVDIHGLDPYSRDLAAILSLLGEGDIPKTMLLRAAQPKWFFNEAGHRDSIPAPNINPLFANDMDLNSALGKLESLSLIRTHKNLGCVEVLPRLRSLCVANTQDMKYKASLLVFHSFPEDSDADPVHQFEELCISQLPHMKHVLDYFEEPDFIKQFSPQDVIRIAYSGLSASGFWDVKWKLRVLVAVEYIIGGGAASPLLLAKLRHRRSVLCYLYPHYVNFNQGPNSLLTSPHSNTFFAELILFEVQVMIYQDDLPRAWHKLEEIITLDASRCDESRILQKKACFQARICLFSGEFDAALKLLRSFEETPTRMFRSVLPYYFTQYVSVCCEGGDINAALKAIPGCDLLGESWQELGVVGRRVSLAAAGTYLMKGLWDIKSGNSLADARVALLAAKNIYGALNTVYSKSANAGLAFTIRRFSVSVGLAMIGHFEWRFSKSISGETALAYWEAALEAGEASSKHLGGTSFPEMIIKNTMCDIASGLGLQDIADVCMRQARTLYQTTGRQFHYLALGSIWFDLVQQWNEENGMGRVSELTYENYMEEQRKTGFPWVKDSVRSTG